MKLHRVFIQIAGITHCITSIDPTLKLQIDGQTQRFITPETTPDINIKAGWDDLAQICFGGKRIFDSGSVWQLYQTEEDYIFSLNSPVFGPLPYKVARVRKDFTGSEVFLHRSYFDPNRALYPLEYPLDELLFIHFLTQGNGVEIHASGVIDSLGQGHLFVGQSGAGKTTISRLWLHEPGVTILSDDRIALRKMDGGLWMYGTPWHGEGGMASPSRAPLTGIYFLIKGEKNELLSVREAEAAARLFTCSFPPFYSSASLDFTLGFLGEVVKAIPCYGLRFLPDRRVVEFIQGLSKGD